MGTHIHTFMKSRSLKIFIIRKLVSIFYPESNLGFDRQAKNKFAAWRLNDKSLNIL